jgi:hypothetical protein
MSEKGKVRKERDYIRDSAPELGQRTSEASQAAGDGHTLKRYLRTHKIRDVD